MPFQVKAAVIGFKGDGEKYPCHFRHKVGDEFIWDEKAFVTKSGVPKWEAFEESLSAEERVALNM